MEAKINNQWYSINEVEDKINDLRSYIDNYTEYIDNYKQYCEAERRNNELYKKIEIMKKVLLEMHIINGELISNNIKTKLEYRNGYFRIKVNGKYKYRKHNRNFKLVDKYK